jgi:NADH:ubiquinone oxidoreductase subunit D
MSDKFTLTKVELSCDKKLLLNFGPQHQQLMEFSIGVELNGEVYRIAIHIWSTTCGTEKLIEHKNFLQSTLL